MPGEDTHTATVTAPQPTVVTSMSGSRFMTFPVGYPKAARTLVNRKIQSAQRIMKTNTPARLTARSLLCRPFPVAVHGSGRLVAQRRQLSG